MSIVETEIALDGKMSRVTCLQFDNRTILSTGKWLKVAVIHDEDLIEGEAFTEPEAVISEMKGTGLKADILTFTQKLPHTNPKFSYYLEWDNLAVIPITSFADWWENRLESSVRRAVRKAAKAGVVVKLAKLDNSFVQGIVSINNETPVRQGRPFWHFQKEFEIVKRENSTYPERNAFLGAYHNDELIGFIRLIYADRVAHIIQLLGKIKHFDKRPMNALIAKAVEICEQKGISFLTYRNYVYNDPKSSLTEFKRRNGFEQILVPRYYIALTVKGKMALKLGLHRGLKSLIPKKVMSHLLRIRSFWYARRTTVLKTA